MSPTNRTVHKLRADGWGLVQTVEQTIPHTFIKRDLFGFGDVLAIRGDELLIVQVTVNMSNLHARLRKMQMLPSVAYWLQSPNRRIEVHGWRKMGGIGRRKTWQCRIENVTMQLQANGETLANFEGTQNENYKTIEKEVVCGVVQGELLERTEK